MRTLSLDLMTRDEILAEAAALSKLVVATAHAGRADSRARCRAQLTALVDAKPWIRTDRGCALVLAALAIAAAPVAA